ncbi:MAG: hypothetical protein IPI67_17745 [Myxococcales bacterium]|nr:hypothetical protein [Myxococcales bacterium]
MAGILLGGTAPGRGDSELDRFFTHEVLSELPRACRRAFFELCRAGELDRELADRLCGDREAIDFKYSARTARALEEVGRGEDAIPIWIDLGRLDEASRVLKANRQQLLMEGRIHLVAGTLARMPRDQIEADPWLLGLHAMLQRFSSTDEALSAA